MQVRGKNWLLVATSAAAIMVGNQALAQDVKTDAASASEKSDKKAEDDANVVDTVIVKGIRGSLNAAAERKRKSAQIVESIESEDVGKLPDNNVPEALSRVTGVQIERVHGEGSNITIRGMSGIATTINGSSNTVGEGRSANLADIPAELLKSVQVYKTRTADQDDGGIAGSVNVELRRPLDLRNGWTVAGSIKNVHGSTGGTDSPYASLLVADRFDTNWGQMGFLANLSYSKNNYQEQFIESESPSTFWGPALTSVTALGHANAIAPYAVNYGIENGSIERPSINLAGQWRVNDNFDVVLEGSYFGSDETRSRDRLHVTVRNDNHTVSNLVLGNDGRTVQSLTLTNASGVDANVQSYREEVDSNNYTTNLEAHWNKGRLSATGQLQYNWSDTNYYGVLTLYRLLDSAGAPIKTVNVDLNSSKVPGRGPVITFPDTNLGDVSRYQLFRVHDEQTYADSKQKVAKLDVSYRVSDDKLVRRVEGGLRYEDRDTNRDYGYRDADVSTALTSFVTGGDYATTTVKIGEASNTWYHLSGKALMANMAAVRQAVGWTTVKPSNNRGQSYVSNEKLLSGFGNLYYGFDLGVPVDGVAGVRVTQTKGDIASAIYNVQTSGPDIITETKGGGRYVDVMPSVNAVIHFTPKIQLRLAYTIDVQRPNFLDTSSWKTIIPAATVVYSGNPDLQANRSTNYDASLEYYFGRGGVLSAGAFLKKPDGYIYYSGVNEPVPELGGAEAMVYKLRNAGPGEFLGYEFSASGFFDFLPGKLRNFGASANFTYMDKFEIRYPFDDPAQRAIPGVYDADSTSKYTYNLALYYDTPQFSARLAYNYRARYKVTVWQEYPEYSPYNDATSRLDAAVNWTPVKQLTLSLEGSNLLKENNNVYWGQDRMLPLGVRVQARTLQVSARFRY